MVFSAVFLILSVSAGALDFLDSQRDVAFVIEQGGSAEFMLTLFNTRTKDALFPGGDIEDWITFGDGNIVIYECENREMDVVKVTIDVPEDAEVGEHNGSILSNSGHINIVVKVVPIMDEIKRLQGLEVINKELQAEAEGIRSELNNTNSELQWKIEEISQYQKELTGLEAELAKVNDKSQELERTNIQLTGQVVSGSSNQLVVGIVIGIVIVILLLKRARIAKAFRSTRRTSARVEREDRYRGWKP